MWMYKDSSLLIIGVMKFIARFGTLLLSLLVLFFFSSGLALYASDKERSFWPTWRGPNDNHKHPIGGGSKTRNAVKP
jgi:hypothetical protein